MPVCAVLFDWDGTLVDSAGPRADPIAAAVGALAEHGLVVSAGPLGTALDAAVPTYKPGVSLEVEPFPRSLARALGVLGLAPTEAACRDAALALYLAATSGDAVYDDARGLLSSLRYRGYRIGVVTNSNFSAKFVAAHAARLGIGGYFDAIVSSCDAGLGKPHAAPYRMALDLLDVAPADALFVGDRLETDIAGAMAAAIPAVLLDRSGRYPPQDVGCPVITRLTALNTLLGESMLA